MSKFNYYAVYGKNRAGIYRSYDKLLRDRIYIDGFKLKGFKTRREAVDYIETGLCQNYQALEKGTLDRALLTKMTNWSFDVRDLIIRHVAPSI